MAIVLVAAGAAMGNEAWNERQERAKFPAPGEVVDIGGGQLMHLRSWGQSAPGHPTLLLFSGAAIPTSVWGWVGPWLAANYRVVAIDRPGMGWSFGGSGQRTAEVSARAIASALTRLDVNPPYGVIAHSFGGFSGRVFIGEHRADVVAAVMLDTSTPDAPGSGYGYLYRMDALRGHLGTGYLFPPPNGYGSLPPDDAAATYAVSRWTSHLDASADELDVWDISAAQTRAAGTLGDLPLLVVTTTGSNASQLDWQHGVERLSSNSDFVILNVGHTPMLTEPDQAAQVVGAIQRFLTAALP